MRRRAFVTLLAIAIAPHARAQPAQPAPAPPPPAQPAPPQAQPGAPTPETAPNAGDAPIRAYHAALAARRLGSLETLRLDDVRARLADAEVLVQAGRRDEAIARLTELVSHPRFEPFAENDEGLAAVTLLGDALASAGAYEPARAYLRRVVGQRA